ncbi:MAG TPA: hypothetical protein VJQ54_12090 [Candidatus Sulfotelmatobacter sp.]|nr:hypothetical protein [Candidatus Sulfotelmatobacter sp.]
MRGTHLLSLIGKILLFAVSLIAFASPSLCAADDWKYMETRRDARDFISGGSIHLRMGVGDLHIRRGDSNQIKLEYTVKSRRESSVKNTRVDIDVHGKDANVEFHAPSGGNTNLDVELEVPESSNLDVHEKVGDLTVENIEGDKDLSLGIGDIRIASGQSGYRFVHASAGIGDVNGADYGQTSGWLGKTLKYRGEGKYELRAHVGIGDIHLEGR